MRCSGWLEACTVSRCADRSCCLRPADVSSPRSPCRSIGFGCLYIDLAVHQLGRTTTYVVLGAAAGITGQMVAWAGFRNGLAIVAGGALLLQAGASVVRYVGRRTARLAGWATRVVGVLSSALPRARAPRAFAVGVLNGLMPCGLLYAALATAAGLGDFRSAVGFLPDLPPARCLYSRCSRSRRARSCQRCRCLAVKPSRRPSSLSGCC